MRRTNLMNGLLRNYQKNLDEPLYHFNTPNFIIMVIRKICTIDRMMTAPASLRTHK